MFSDLIPRIRNWAKSVPSKSEPKLMKVCDHDWETVKVSGTLERMIESIDGVSDVDTDFRMGLPSSRILVSFKFGGERYHVFEPKGIKTNPVQKVCLKCNKCVDEIKVVRGRWVDLITEEINKEKERARRRELARKMWRNCHE